MFSIIEIARSNPELIIFLNKLDDLKSHKNELHYVGSSTCPSSITSKEVETQTETHPIPSNIDKNYHWNIWDLRRKAISLAYLMKCGTNSTQTKISYAKFDANTQTFSARGRETQTRCNGSTDMPKLTTLHSYIRDFGEDICFDLPHASEGMSAASFPHSPGERQAASLRDFAVHLPSEDRPAISLPDASEEIPAVNVEDYTHAFSFESLN